MLFAFSLGFSQTPTNNAPAPTHAAADVVSIYGSTYPTNIATNYNPNWGQTGTVNPSFDPGTGHLVLAYNNFNYQGTELTTTNVSNMEYLHVDIWTANATAVKVTPINNGTGPSEVLVSVPLTPGSWSSVDLPKSAFIGMTWDSVYQMKFDGQGGASPSDIYLDNIYFWKSAANPTTDATLSDLKIDGNTIPNFASGTTDYIYNLVVGTTTVPQITASTTTQSSATKVITQATSIPGSATVVVTAPDGVTKQTYTVNITATAPNASPFHSTTGMLLPLNYASSASVNDTGTPTSATAWNPDYSFGSFNSIKNLGTTSSPNTAIYTKLVNGYGAGRNGVMDVSGYSYLNFDYFIPADETPGVNGDQFYFDLISDNPVKESFYYIKPAVDNGDGVMVKGSWQTVSIPIATFTAKGFNPTQFFQFKFGADSDLNTSAIYFDNIYFSTTPATLGIKEAGIQKNNLKVYPNPVNAGSNIMISGKVKTVEVYNMNGQLVKTSASQTVSSQGLTKGVYLVKATDNNGTVQTTKVIVK